MNAQAEAEAEAEAVTQHSSISIVHQYWHWNSPHLCSMHTTVCEYCYGVLLVISIV
jgi:hypothetical protein